MLEWCVFVCLLAFFLLIVLYELCSVRGTQLDRASS